MTIRPFVVASACLALLTWVAPVLATDYYWSGDTITAGGPGNWTQTSANWSTSPTGPFTINQATIGTGTSVNIFDGSSGGAINITGTVDVRWLTFDAPGYVLSGGTITRTTSTGFIVDGAEDVTINSNIVLPSGSRLGKQGTNTLTLTGTNDRGTNINAGTVIAGPSARIGIVILSSGATLVLDSGNAGNLRLADGTSAQFTFNAGGTLASSNAGGVSITNAVLASSGTLNFGNASYTEPMSFTQAFASTAARTLNVAADTSVTFSGNLTGAAGSYAKTGAGTAIFSGTNGYTGATTVSGGILSLDYSTNNTSKLADGAALNLAGGTLDLTGSSHTEVVASTSLTAGTASAVTSTSGSSVLRMNTITRNAGATIDFGANGIADTNTSNNAAGILGTWATVGGVDWATSAAVAANTPITAYTGYTDVTRLSSGAKVIADGSTSNVRIVEGTGSAANLTLGAATTTINTLNQSASGGASAATIDLAGQTLGVNGILVGTGAGGLTLGTAANNGTLRAASAGGELVLNNQTAGALTVNSVIANNSGASSLSLAGAGTVTLNGINTYTGATTIVGGTLTIGGAGQLGSGAYAGAITNNGAFQYHSSAAQTLSGVVSGSGSIIQDGSGTLTLSNTANTYSGGTTINAGTLKVSTTGTVTTLGSGAVTINGGTLNLTNTGGATVLAVANTITGTGTVAISGTSAPASGNAVRTQVTGDLSGFTGDFHVLANGNFAAWNAGATGSIATLNQNLTIDSGGYLSLLGTATTSFGGLFGTGSITKNSGANIATLSIGNGDANGSFDGVISSGNLVGGSGSIALIKTGAGTQILTKANLYTNTTTVDNGTLQLSGATASLASTSYTLRTGGTLELSSTAGNAVPNNATFFGNSGLGTIKLGSSITETIDNIQTTANGAQVVVDVASGSTLTSRLFPGTSTTSGEITLVGPGSVSSNVNGGVVRIGHLNGSSGTLTLQSGVTLTTVAGISSGDSGNGSVGSLLDIQSGSIDATSGSQIVEARTMKVNGSLTTSATGQIVIDGGGALGNSSIASGSTVTTNRLFLGTFSNVAVLDQNGGNVTVTRVTLDHNGGASSATYNLNGGILTINSNTAGQGIDERTGSSTFNFNGGTLRAGDNNSNLMVIDTANVKDGGATIDTQAFATTIAQPLLHFAGATTDGLTKLGTGTLTLSGASTYSGATAIKNGTLALGGGNDRLPTGTTVTLGDGLTNDSGVLKLDGHNQQLAGLFTAGAGAGNRVVNGNATSATLTLDIASGNDTFGGILGGPGANENNFALVKSSAGTLTLTGTNTYSGTTSIQGGVVKAASAAALGATGGASGTTVDSGTTLELATGLSYNAESLTLNGAGYPGFGAESGALLFDDGGATTWNGPITLGSNATIGVFNAGTLNLTGGIMKNGFTVKFLGNGLANVANVNTTPISGVADLDVDNMTVNLNVANTYSGPTLVQNGGLLNLNVNNALPSPTFSPVTIQTGGEMNRAALTSNTAASLTLDNGAVTGGGTLVLAGNVTSDNTSSMTGGATDLNGSRTFTVNSGTLSVSDALIGAGGSLTKQGPGALELSGASTYSGSTTVEAGLLHLSGGGLENSNINVNAGTFRQTAGTNNVTGAGGNLTIAAGATGYQLRGGTLNFGDYAAGGTAWTPNDVSIIALDNGSQFEFTGGSLLDVSQISTNGTTFMQQGGNFYVGQNNSGPAALTTISGGYSLLSGVLHLDAFGADTSPEECCDGVASLNDQLTVTGDAFLDSVVNIDFVGFTPVFGDVFTLICANDIVLGDNFALTGGYFRVVPTGLGPEQPQYALQAIVPEPASVAVWSMIGLAGVAAATQRMRRKRLLARR